MAYERGPDPSASFRFHVEIESLKEVARFSECSGLEFEMETFPYKEGGLNSRIHQLPGRFKFTNLTLKKGIATDGAKLWDWVKDVVKNANTGQFETHNVTVTLYDVSGKKVMRSWLFYDAFPVKWSASALTADHSAIAIETLALAHQGMDIAQ
jgi:phage tail-like protein